MLAKGIAFTMLANRPPRIMHAPEITIIYARLTPFPLHGYVITSFNLNRRWGFNRNGHWCCTRIRHWCLNRNLQAFVRNFAGQ
jgi:hypothetical protein